MTDRRDRPFQSQQHLPPAILPYNAIPDWIARLPVGQLVSWRETVLGDVDVAREIWMPPALAAAINAPKWTPVGSESHNRADRRRRDTRAFLAGFVTGTPLQIGTGDDRCDIKCLHPVPGAPWREWELRITPEDPHTRIFGVWGGAYRDFVAMSINAKAAIIGTQTKLGQQALIDYNNLTRPPLPFSFRDRPNAQSLLGSSCGYY